MSDIVAKIKSAIEGFEPSEYTEKIGRVVKVGDGIVEIEGLSDAGMSEIIEFDTTNGEKVENIISKETGPVLGMILNLEEDKVRAIILGNGDLIREGMIVKNTGKELSLPVSDELVGRVVNPLGEIIDGGIAIKADKFNPLERKAYGVIERSAVNTPLHTGIKAIDSMIPIGRGQRELIIGDRQTGKTTIGIDTIINQKNEPKEKRPICIYVAIGQKDSKIAKLVQELKERGAMEYTIIISAPASAPAAFQFLAPYAGAAIGEYFMEKGKDALVIYDDLTKHASAYRQISLLLRRPPGREAYSGDIFYLHSRLLERAAKLNQTLGGGSLTALPIIETQGNDISAYIPTNVISITDGQIYLEADLFNKGIKPAINVGLSVSRVGGSAQTKAMKKVSGKIRLDLAQFRELEAFVQFSQDLDEETKRRIDRGRLMTEILKQDKHQPLGFEEQVSLIYAATNDFLLGANVQNVQSVSGKLIDYLKSQKAEVLEAIKKSGEIGKETEEDLKKALQNFREAHGELFAK